MKVSSLRMAAMTSSSSVRNSLARPGFKGMLTKMTNGSALLILFPACTMVSRRSRPDCGYCRPAPLTLLSASCGKAVAEHGQSALRFGLGRLVLEDIPVFGQHTVGDPHDVSGDP